MKNSIKSAAIKAVKATVGACAAIALALALGLSYPTAAGIITLLSLQETKKETLSTAARRIPIFLAGVVIAFCSFWLLGYTVAGLALYLVGFVLLCHLFSAGADIAMCSVLVTHFWVEQSMSWAMIANEFLLLVIGAGIGILLNLFLPVGMRTILRSQQEIDFVIRQVLDRLADELRGKPTDEPPELAKLEQLLAKAREQASQASGNALTLDLSYYREYIDMRTNQFLVLQRIQVALLRITEMPPQAEELALFLHRISSSFGESNNAVALLQDAGRVRDAFRSSDLPLSRQEFENRATLLQIFSELEHFLLLKMTFAWSLTREQRVRYWDEPAREVKKKR